MAMVKLGGIFNQNNGASKPQKLPIHHHVLHPSVFPFDCFGCSETKDAGEEGYYCPQCKFYFHKKCAESPLEINHPSHPAHPLKLRRFGPPVYSDGSCRLCGEDLRLLVYHCSNCNFSLCTACPRKHEIPSIFYLKAHEHRLHLVAKHFSFPCDACGLDGQRSPPYLCRQCNFMMHGDCIFLPREILITRHKHRIYRSYFIGPGKFDCGVCRLKLDGRYGGYRCSICPNYVFHLKCATRDDVWDGIELEGIPEEKDDTEDIKPFEEVNEEEIKHFSHKHNLRLNEEGNVCHETIHCNACALPVYFDAYYSCLRCAFVLHKTCASFPKKLRHELHKHPLTLQPNTAPYSDRGINLFYCTACQQLCSGFKYVCCDVEFDVRCCSIREPFIHKNHLHPLYLTPSEAKVCGACNETASPVLNCVACDFALGFECATLPNKVKHKCDAHFLTVRFGEKSSDPYWCDVCEKQTNPSERFFNCDECTSTLHINCVIGSFTFWRPGYVFVSNYEVEMIPNNFASRPICFVCYCRCEDTSGIIYILEKYLCSTRCLERCFGLGLTLKKMLQLKSTNDWKRFQSYWNLFQSYYIR